MIRYKDTTLEDFFIDPETAIITNSKGEIQKTKINERGRPCFNCMEIHRIQVHTHLGYKKDYDIHHIDENKLNNSLENLVYLTHSEHSKIHNKIGKKLSEETKQKMRAANKGKNKDRTWINNGMINKFVKIEEEIPEGFVGGMLKNINRIKIKKSL